MKLTKNKIFFGILIFGLIVNLLVFFDIQYLYLRAIFMNIAERNPYPTSLTLIVDIFSIGSIFLEKIILLKHQNHRSNLCRQLLMAVF